MIDKLRGVGTLQAIAIIALAIGLLSTVPSHSAHAYSTVPAGGGHYTAATSQGALSTDATLSALTLSDVNFGTFASGTTSYTASIYHSVSETTVAPTVNHSGASYVIKLGGVTDAERIISLAVGSNVITVEGTAEDGQTTKTYTVTVNRAAADAPTTGELSTDDPPVNFRAVSISPTQVIYSLNIPRNRGITAYVLQGYEHHGTNFVSSGANARLERSESYALGGWFLAFSDAHLEARAQYKWVAQLKNSGDSIVIEASVTVRIPLQDATLSALTLSGVDFGTFASDTTEDERRVLQIIAWSIDAINYRQMLHL